jgi:hypothetical protein
MTAGRRFALALLIAASAAACTSTRDALVEEGYSPSYAQGYEHGCATGKAELGGLFSTAQKDASAYASDSQYAQGWDAGHAKCRGDMQAMVSDARARPYTRDKND